MNKKIFESKFCFYDKINKLSEILEGQLLEKILNVKLDKKILLKDDRIEFLNEESEIIIHLEQQKEAIQSKIDNIIGDYTIDDIKGQNHLKRSDFKYMEIDIDLLEKELAKLKKIKDKIKEEKNTKGKIFNSINDIFEYAMDNELSITKLRNLLETL